MRTNQIETGSLRLAGDARAAARGSNLATSAFTLTELLVVITIIAILAALITGAASNALRRAKEAAISVEVTADWATRSKTLRTGYGAYPPNCMIPSGI